MIRKLFKVRFLLLVLPVMLAGAWPVAAQAAAGTGPAAGFAVLASSAVTCTGSTVTGAVGVASSSTAVTNTGCTMPTVQVATAAYADFLNIYSGIAGNLGGCTVLTGTLAGRSLGAGTYCFTAAATLTGTLTLTGSGPWLFEIGTGGTGALTTTNFTIVGSNPCGATWWVRQAVTLTTSAFQGTVLAGTDITLTNTVLAGRAFAKGAVTMTTSHVIGCTGAITGGGGHNGDGDNDNDKQCASSEDHGHGQGHDSEGCKSGDSDNKDKSKNDDHGSSDNQGHHGGD